MFIEIGTRTILCTGQIYFCFQLARGVAHLDIYLTLAQRNVEADGRSEEESVVADVLSQREGIAVVHLGKGRPSLCQQVVPRAGKHGPESCVLVGAASIVDVADACPGSYAEMLPKAVGSRHIQLVSIITQPTVVKAIADLCRHIHLCRCRAVWLAINRLAKSFFVLFITSYSQILNSDFGVLPVFLLEVFIP